MTRKKGKVFVAVSGGVDSATTAAILIRDGYECEAIFMITNDSAQAAEADAGKVADKLGIKLHILDFRQDFERIFEYFANEYRQGRTPNPCVFCNRHIKFGKLWEFAAGKGADFMATGHYARVLEKEGRFGLYAAETRKDQSYVLAMIDRSVLPHILLPMGEHPSKEHTRKLAKEFGLEVENKPDSQEICFIPDNDYSGWLEKRCPELAHSGHIVDKDGKILGEHNGIHKFTIGQRRGARVAMGKPYYVIGVDAANNTVVLGPREELMHRHLYAKEVNWLIDKPEGPFAANIKIRYNHSGAAGVVTPDGNGAMVEFEQAVPAITPGQAAVFYIGEEVAGGGWIERVWD